MSRFIFFVVPLLLIACEEEDQRSQPDGLGTVEMWETEEVEDVATAARLDRYERKVPSGFVTQCDLDAEDADAYCVNDTVRGQGDAIDACALAAGVPADVVEEQRATYWDGEPTGEPAADEHLERLQLLYSIPLSCRVSEVPTSAAHESLTFAYWVGTCD